MLTKQEATDIILKHKYSGEYGDWFCPLISDTCNQSCLCFKKITLVERGKDNFQIFPEYCSNEMFSKD